MDAILSYKPVAEEDYYSILGCFPDSTTEQLNAEYRVRARELHPDKNAEEATSTTDKFQLLQLAKETLTDPEKRADYDRWRNSGLAITYKDWRSMKGKTNAGMHWAPPKAGKKMLQEKPESELTSPGQEREQTQQGIAPENGSHSVPFSWTRDERSRRFQNYEF